MAIFYLYAINTLVTWGTAVGMLVLGFSQGSSGVITYGGFVTIIALVQTGITFALEQDFAHDKRRICRWTTLVIRLRGPDFRAGDFRLWPSLPTTAG